MPGPNYTGTDQDREIKREYDTAKEEVLVRRLVMASTTFLLGMAAGAATGGAAWIPLALLAIHWGYNKVVNEICRKREDGAVVRQLKANADPQMTVLGGKGLLRIGL